MTGGLTNYGTIQNFNFEPYCSVASFRAAPTWLDSNDLIPGGTQSKQDFEIYNVLMRATSWADLYTGGATESPYLGASIYNENKRARTTSWGSVILHPDKSPIQYVSQILTGSSPLNLSPVAEVSNLWIEDNRQIEVPVSGAGQFVGLQFGPNVVPGGSTYVNITYDAGYFNSTLATGTYNQGTMSVAVVNPVGLIPGTSFRINDPGQEEVVQVGANYVPHSATVPLVNPLVYTHTAPASTSPGTVIGCSALPYGVEQAVISYAVGLLLREDTSSQAPFANTPFGPATRKSAAGGKAAGLISDAQGYLDPLRRVR